MSNTNKTENHLLTQSVSEQLTVKSAKREFIPFNIRHDQKRLEEVFSKSLEELRQSAYQEGWQKGYQDGKETALVEFQAQKEVLISEFQASVRKQFDEILNQISGEFIRNAYQVLDKLVEGFLKAFLNLSAEDLTQLQLKYQVPIILSHLKSKPVTLVLNPMYQHLIQTESWPEIRVKLDPNIQPGEIHLEIDDEKILIQWQQFLEQLIAWLKAGKHDGSL